jgi:hypothetical protein
VKNNSLDNKQDEGDRRNAGTICRMIYTQVDSKFGQQAAFNLASWPNFESTWVYLAYPATCDPAYPVFFYR